MFGAVGAWGYVTKRDLSTMGTVMLMALVGLILATIVNLFWANETLYWITTYAGVAIFAGLTAYDMQKIKGYAHAGLGGRRGAARVDPGRAGPLPRLHQPVPVPAADLRPEPLSGASAAPRSAYSLSSAGRVRDRHND